MAFCLVNTEVEGDSSNDHMTEDLDSHSLVAPSGDHVTKHPSSDLLRGLDTADSADIDRLFDSLAPNLTTDSLATSLTVDPEPASLSGSDTNLL